MTVFEDIKSNFGKESLQNWNAAIFFATVNFFEININKQYFYLLCCQKSFTFWNYF